MEKLNNSRLYKPGDRFVIVDLNSLRIPRTDENEQPVVVQLKPRILPACVTKVDPAHEKDQLWQRIFLQANTSPYRKGNTFEMHTKRRIHREVFADRRWHYLYVAETDPTILMEILGNLGDLDPRLANANLARLFAEQLIDETR